MVVCCALYSPSSFTSPFTALQVILLLQEKRLKAENDMVAMETQMKDASEKIKDRHSKLNAVTPSSVK